MKHCLLIVFVCILSCNILAQSKAEAFASVTIVTPVGVTISPETYQPYTCMKPKNNKHFASSKNRVQLNEQIGTEQVVTTAASLHIIGSMHVFDVTIQSEPVVLRSRENNLITAVVSSGRKNQSYDMDGTIDVLADILFSAKQSNGLYTTVKPYVVTVNYN